MTLSIVKTRFMNHDDFHLLIQVDKDIAKAMFSNKVMIQGPKAGNTKRVKELMEWVENNCNGLIYVQSNNTPQKYRMNFYFELESDMTAFKLVWIN